MGPQVHLCVEAHDGQAKTETGPSPGTRTAWTWSDFKRPQLGDASWGPNPFLEWEGTAARTGVQSVGCWGHGPPASAAKEESINL